MAPQMDNDTAKRTVIIGGVAAGMSAATRLRRNDENREIIVLESGENVSFANCGLPYYIGDVITDRDELLLQTPESLQARFRLDVRVQHEAIAIRPDLHEVEVRHRVSGESSVVTYDDLIIATGARPLIPNLAGIERALSLRDVSDADALHAAVDTAVSGSGASKTAVVMGAGFVGLEVAENLSRRGLDVTVVELGTQILAPLDPEMAAPVEQWLREHGLSVVTGLGVVSIEKDSVTLSDGSSLPADIVVAAVGVRPASELARAAGIAVGERGGIAVDASHRTSAPDVYAAGDVAEKVDAITDEPTLVALAQTANRHGRLIADVIVGREVGSKPVWGTAVVGLFDLTVAMTGWSEKRLRAAGRDVRVIHTHPASHAGYYPGAEGMSLKLLVDPHTDAILGVQGVGGAGVDKRIDVIATAIQGGITATGLADLELAYAPQFGSAKDPVVMLGMVADNLASGHERTMQWHELAAAQAAGAVLVDVRTVAEYDAADIPGSINIPLDDLRARAEEIPAGPVIVHCAVGVRGHSAARILKGLGRDVVNLDGGFRTWKAGVGE